ncbi:MAG: helix-hairpin-helix domain-containing protein [Desulfobacterales bacterium]|nr:helix-hairpin-helix domain-containing protein [Desulfobacterales bacterium]
MIGFLEGRILRYERDGILLQAGSIGFEILVNPITIERVKAQAEEPDVVSLYIYYHVAERQPKPVLIGFASPMDKEFFQLFISVSAIGPMKAIKALTFPTEQVATAIEQKDVGFLSKMPGIGKRTAEKIIATLHGKAMAFVGDGFSSDEETVDPPAKAKGPEKLDEISSQVAEVLTEQLGHSTGSAKRLIRDAFDRNPDIQSPEELFDEIYREGH